MHGIKIGDDLSHSKSDFTEIEFIISNYFDYDNEDKHSKTVIYLDAIDFSESSGYYDGRSFAWDYTLDEIQEYGWEYGNLSIFTNIDTDLFENIVEMDTTTDYGEFKAILSPEGDDFHPWAYWSYSSGDDYYTEIDEKEGDWGWEYPLTTIEWYSSDYYDLDGFDVRFDFPTISNLDNLEITEVIIHILARGNAEPTDLTKAMITFDDGTSWSSQLGNRIDGSWDWYTYTWSGLEEDDFDDFQVELECPDCPTTGRSGEIDVLYVEVSYEKTVSTSQEIISSKEDHNNVMEIEVFGQEASCNFYRDLGSSYNPGTIEFWINKASYYTLIDVDEFLQITQTGDIVVYGTQTALKGKAIKIDSWNHFKIDYTTSSFDLYCDGIKIGDDLSHSKSDFTEIEFIISNYFDYDNEDKHSKTVIYLDAIDFSESSGYYDGRSFAWDYTLDEIQEYGWEYGNLSIFTNIDTDLFENIVEMDTTTDIAEFDFYLNLEGTHNPTVNYTFSIPEGFSITPNGISQSLDSNVEFNISANDPYQLAGVYYFDMNITFSDNDTIIYYEHVPFRIPVVEDLQITQSNILFEEIDINGNYTATYDFLDDTIGGNPSGWAVLEPTGTSVQVISSLDGHNNVAEIYDNHDPNLSYIKNTFSAVTEGSVEFWFRTTDISKTSNIKLCGASGSVQLYVKDSKLQYYDTSYRDIDATITSDTWYHMIIVFDIGDNGDGTDDWHLIIDGQTVSPAEGFEYYLDPSNILELYITSYSSHSAYYTYIDAVGYSWASDYKIGDNMYKTETNSDTYQSSTQLEKGDLLFVEYKTNTYAETIMNLLNNNVIQATYTVVPRGNSFSGIQYQQILINGTFSFDEIEFSNYEYNYFEVYHISIIDAGITVSQQFNPLNFTNNGNVPEFVSFSFSGVPFDNISQTLYPNEFFGETQIAVILPNSNRINEFNITLPDESISNLFWRGITYAESGTNNIYNIYIDNLEIDGIHIVSPENKTHNIIGETISSGKYEMNLEIIPEENLVWSAYSLNGQSNVTFSTSANITLPETYGIHSIQVFGNNSVGTMFQSEVRNFTISYPIKILTIANGTTYYDTNNEINVYATSACCSNFEYSLDGRPRKNLNTTTNLIEHIPFGSRNIIIYGDDTYGHEYSSGLIEFYIALDRQSASQPDGFTFANGTFSEPYGDLQFIDGNYSKLMYGIDLYDVPDEFIDSITYNHGYNGGGTIPNTYTDDANYKQVNAEYMGNPFYAYWIYVTFNFNPALSGRDFYISAHIATSEGNTGRLRVNGYDWKTGSNIDFDNELKTGVTSITFHTDKIAENHNSKIYYLKLVEDTTGIDALLDVQIDMQVNDTDLHEVEFLQYSHRTNISTIVDLDIWNWTSSQWHEIESVNNYATFDDHRVALGNNSDYLNLTDNSVRIRYQSTATIYAQLEIDSLKLLYSTNVIPLNLYSTPIQPDNFSITEGSFDTYGELVTIDANYSVIEADYDVIDSYLIIKPDGDATPNQWNDGNGGATHWDDLIESVTSPDNTYVKEDDTTGLIEVYNCGTGDIQGASVYKVVIRYCYYGSGYAGYDAYIDINLGGWQGYKKVSRPPVTWQVQELEWTGLSGSQVNVNSFQIRFNSYFFGAGKANYFTAIEVKIYYSKSGTDLDVQIDLQIDDEYCYFPNSISYSYKTNVSQIIDFDIWNWDTESWYEIESVNNYETFDDDIFYLDYGSAYVNSSNGIRIRFQAFEGENDFQIEIDQLRLDYYNIG